MTRPTWDQTIFGILDTLSARATCPRLHTACVVVSPEHQILSTGYNGAPRGIHDCSETGCLVINGHCLRAIHAEQNAILQAAYQGTKIRDATFYVKHQPCYICARMIVQAGACEVVYGVAEPYDTDNLQALVHDLFDQAHVGYRFVGPS